MKVAITGATGFIGRHLVESLLGEGHSVLALTRSYKNAAAHLPTEAVALQWAGPEEEQWVHEVARCDAIVNLAGENLSSGRWTKSKRRALLESRLEAISTLRKPIEQHTGGRLTLIEASAVGYYGPRDDDELSEDAAAGSGYLAEIASQCEREAAKLASDRTRVVLIRTGIVLGREAGLLPRLFSPLRLGFGGYPGNGRQWLSWIHIDDEVGAIKFLLENQGLEGAYNLTAPMPLRMGEFLRTGGKLLHRPVWFPLPAWGLRVVFGEMADEALLAGQRVVPKRLRDAGYAFAYPDAESALTSLLRP